MIKPSNRDIDLPAEGGSELRTRLVDDLRRYHQPVPKLATVDAAIMQSVHACRSRLAGATRAAKGHGGRLRLGVPLAGLVLFALSVGVYIHAQRPTPASAQTILRHAATAGLVPNQVTHFVYQITSSTGFTGTTQFWVQANGAGALQRLAVDRTASENAAFPRVVGAYAVYGAIFHIRLPALADSQAGGQQTLDGVLVDTVRTPEGSVLYFDAHSYIERGADWTDGADGVAPQPRGRLDSGSTELCLSPLSPRLPGSVAGPHRHRRLRHHSRQTHAIFARSSGSMAVPAEASQGRTAVVRFSAIECGLECVESATHSEATAVREKRRRRDPIVK